MANKGFLNSILICMFILVSCSKSPICWGDDKNEGLIVKYYSMHDFPSCLEGQVQENDNIIIKDTVELQNIIGNSCENLTEAGYSDNPPNIDFNSYSLLGFWTTGKCETKFKREVKKDENNKKIIYTIDIKDCGWCYSERYDANLVLVPRFDDDYIVEFIKKDKD